MNPPNLFRQESDEWHAAARREDEKAIADGISGEEINQRNALIPNAREWELVNLGETMERCYEEEA